MRERHAGLVGAATAGVRHTGPAVPLVLLSAAMLLVGLHLGRPAPAWPGQPADPSESRQLREANRLLEEELLVAAKPQIYLLLDLTHSAILIKARGIELYRLPIQGWRLSGQSDWPRLYRVQRRPPVDRTEARIGTDATADPVELAEMPAEFILTCDPPLQVSISPALLKHPWYWAQHRARVWSEQLRARSRGDSTRSSPDPPWLSLTLLIEDARSLAWALTDGMPLLIGRPLKESDVNP